MTSCRTSASLQGYRATTAPCKSLPRRSVVKTHPSNDRSPGAHGRSARGFDRLYSFHTTRDTSVTAVYRMTRDLFLAQRFARHLSPLTTVVYTHPSDQDPARSLSC